MTLSNRDSEILRELVLHGPTIGNELSRKLGLASSTVSTRIRKLQEQGLISCREQQTLERPQVHIRISLTVKGLATALNDLFIQPVPHPTIDNVRSLNLLGDALEKIAIIAETWKELLPEVFGLWNFFREGEGTERIAAERLMHAAWAVTNRLDSMSRGSGYLWNPSGTDRNDPVDHLRSVFTRFFYSLLADPTFLQDVYLFRWIESQRRTDIDIDDAPLIKWVYHLKENEVTEKHVIDNLRRAEGQIAKLTLVTALLGDDRVEADELERTMMLIARGFYLS